MSYFAEARLRELCQELVRLLRSPQVQPTLDYLPPIPQEGARRVVVGVKGKARVLLDADLAAGEIRVYRQVGQLPLSLEDGYELGPAAEARHTGHDGEASLEQYGSGQELAEALLKRLDEEYRTV